MTDSGPEINRKTIIIGAGQAGVEVATALRQRGYRGHILLMGDEPHLPYRRPPLSKSYLSGDVTAESLQVKPRATLDKAGIDFRPSVHVARIHRASHEVELADGERLHYDKLVLATGGRSRCLTTPGAVASNLFYLRTLTDVDAIRAEFSAGKRLLIIGGGYIGLEVAAVAVQKGLDVTVLESGARVLARVTAPQMSDFYESVHRAAGVDLRTGVKLHSFEQENGRVIAARLEDGNRIATDFVIAGIGLVPNTELAAEAGLEVADGIHVNEFGATSDPDILAAGDCASHPNALLGRRLRLESVPNATEQARTIAAAICEASTPYQPVPWFWSDQYDLKLQMVGLSEGFDHVALRGDPANRCFSAFYFRDGRIIAVDCVSRAAEFMLAKRLVSEQSQATPAQVSDEMFPLKSLLNSTS